MPTLCIQCSMRAMVSGEPPPMFDEKPEEHQARVHPDQEAVQRERVELGRKLEQMIKDRTLKLGRGPRS